MVRTSGWVVMAAMVLGAFAPGPAWSRQGAAGQDPALGAIQQAGGRVERDDSGPEKPVVAVSFAVTQAGDAVLEPLKGLPKLRKLTLNNTKITDAGLDQVKALAGLQKLYLVDTAITDAGLEKLKGMAELRVLSLVGTPITDAGLEHLKALPNLQEAFLAGTKVTEDGVKKLKEALPKVRFDR